LVPKCTKDEFNEASKNMIKAVYLAKDSLILDISFIRPKYKGKEKSPIVVVRNKELDVWLRQFLEELI